MLTKNRYIDFGIKYQTHFRHIMTVLSRTVAVDGLDMFYREAGSRTNPTILLLHGTPASSHMFRDLMPALQDKFHLVAPDYIGFGNSARPSVDDFDYTFDHLAEMMDKFVAAIGLKKYILYVQDYGAPVGYRLAVMHPDKVLGLIVQNGNAYDEGLDNPFWDPVRVYWKDRTVENGEALRGLIEIEGTKWMYVNGTKDPSKMSPDAWIMDQYFLERPGSDAIQLALFYDYRSNPPLYPKWQEYFRKYQPPTLIVWGEHDEIFPKEGAIPYKRDLKNLEYHLLDTGHFALEECSEEIAMHIDNFFGGPVVA
jgi:pimeloyl-ACP methyl ester carboxylesterase